MGSGVSSIYKGTIQESQPYSSSYNVVDEMLEYDKKDNDIYDELTGYFLNPLSQQLSDSIKDDNIYIDQKKANGILTYVMNLDGELVFGKRFNPNNIKKRAPHPTLIGGINPRVKCAGMITFINGKIYSIDNRSGHYKPNIISLEFVDNYLNELSQKNPNIFHKKSKWRKNNE